MNWMKNNVKWFGPTVMVFLAVMAFLADYIPMPAKAADLNQLADIVQQTHETVQRIQETQEESKSDHRIKHLQDQIASIRVSFMSNGRPLSPEAIFYIQEKETEIENIRKGEE